VLTSPAATAVSRVENLEFLADVIPPTVPYKMVRERKNKAAKEKEAESGQLTLNGQRILPIGASSGDLNGKGKPGAMMNKETEGGAEEDSGGSNGGEKDLEMS
jgi:hypothetical protein